MGMTSQVTSIFAVFQTTSADKKSNECASRIDPAVRQEKPYLRAILAKSIPSRLTISSIPHTISVTGLLQDGMSTAAAMVCGLRVSTTIVVVEHEVFAFVPDDVGYTIKVPRVFGNDESHRVIRDDHTCREDVAALVVFAARVLRRRLAAAGAKRAADSPAVVRSRRDHGGAAGALCL